MSARFLIIYASLLFMQGNQAVTKTWICNTNADDKNNWIGGDYMKNCTGFHFPPSFGDICVMSIGKLVTNAIYLPEQGSISLRDNAEIVFSENSDACVMVRDDLKMRDYNDPQCWKNENEAVPDLERSPCLADDVVFPDNATYSVTKKYLFEFERSYTIRSQPVKYDELAYLFFVKRSVCSEFFSLYADHRTRGRTKKCRGPDLYSHVCNIRKNWRKISCASPVYVEGHCTLFCGSVLRVTANPEFNITKLFNTFKKDNTDAYYSVIKDSYDSQAYQILITDKGEFTGDSISHVQKIYDQVKSDLRLWDITDINAQFSGFPLTPDKDFQHAIGIVLGTLFAVILLFVVMFLVYMGPLEHVNITQRIPRIPFIRRTRRSTKPFVFAKFDNKDDGVTSIAGSIVSLDKAFDNPMYGHQIASTSSGSMMETVEEGEEMKESSAKVISESQFSNPLYEEDKITVETVDD